MYVCQIVRTSNLKQSHCSICIKGTAVLQMSSARDLYLLFVLVIWWPIYHLTICHALLLQENCSLAKGIGCPILYTTTRDFLDCFASPCNSAKMHLILKKAVFPSPEFPLKFRISKIKALINKVKKVSLSRNCITNNGRPYIYSALHSLYKTPLFTIPEGNDI